MSMLINFNNVNDTSLSVEKSCKRIPCDAFTDDAWKRSLFDSLDLGFVSFLRSK